ncbi:hypothetical protein L1887_09119 [Cichorium endivia]|nr:hypothetical protein L1887_09119 [Cichorium endivia]
MWPSDYHMISTKLSIEILHPHPYIHPQICPKLSIEIFHPPAACKRLRSPEKNFISFYCRIRAELLFLV